ncbi:MAG: U32 family peptidase [Ruminococcus sp.]|nr:U32 family peptidase [Ruminococcus sp.]
MTRKKPEILAPAGSMETLVAALRSGADAVYVGGKKFSARNGAVNFTLEELAQAADMCHLYGARLYLAVNTIIADSEAQEFCEYIKSAARSGIDAFIVQDFGAAMLIRKCVPNAVLHGPTQMTVHTAMGARFLRDMNFSRVVPARELEKGTVEKICNTGIEVEIFVHGALCMSVSGQCYTSAVIGSRSANRGCCGQACRLPFSACGNKNNAALSLKDLSLIPIISKAGEIGVDSLKIEGRMKRPEYAASAVNTLVQALDGQNPDMQLLRGIFSRSGFTDGYFTGRRHDMFGVRQREDVIAAQSLIPKIHELYRCERKVRTVDFHVIIKSHEPVRITASCGGFTEAVTADPPEKAMNRPTDLQMLEKQLSRLGDTVFSLGSVTAEIDDGLILTAGRINELRRLLIEKLSERIISEARHKYSITDFSPHINKAKAASGVKSLPIRTICRTDEQVRAAADLSELVVVPHDLLLERDYDDIPKEKIMISPPRFIVSEEKLCRELPLLREKGYSHLLCHTLDSAAVGRDLKFTLHGSFSLNIYNSYSAEYLKSLGFADFIVSFEARISQIHGLSADIPMGAVIYGRLPLMLTRCCPIKNEVGCGKCGGFITDRTGRNFPVKCTPDYAEILNSDTLYMFDKTDLTDYISFGVVMLSGENAAQAADAINGIKPSAHITRGLYYRGI